MNGWIALSLTLLLGQTAPPTEEEQRADRELEYQQLRAQVEALQAQLETLQQEHQTRLQTLEQRQATEVARAQELEQLRQEGLMSLQQAYEWLVTLDQLLELGEIDDAGVPLTRARSELSNALASAEGSGRGQTVRLLEGVLERLATVDDAVAERDLHPARQQLLAAGHELLEAWRLSLNRPSASLVTPP